MEDIICIAVESNDIGLQQTVDIPSEVINSTTEKQTIQIIQNSNSELQQKETSGNIFLIVQDINSSAHENEIVENEKLETYTPNKDTLERKTNQGHELSIQNETNHDNNKKNEAELPKINEKNSHPNEEEEEETSKPHCRYCERTQNYRKETGDNRDIPLIVKRVRCPICLKFLAPTTKFDAHLRSHTEERPFSCDVCLQPFKRSDSLAVHKRRCRGEKTAFQTEKVECKICSRQFMGQAALRRHNFHKHMEKAERVSKKPNSKRFLCEACPKVFHSKTTLNAHRRVHSGEKPFLCLECGKAFGTRTGLHCHIQSHSGVKAFCCNICQKEFVHHSSLDKHIQIHLGIKHYQCEVCSKQFLRSGDYRIHQRIHTGEKPYVCDICSRPFSRSQHLKAHYRVHTKEKPFVCELCGKAFTQKSTLNSHRKRHETVKED